MSILTQQINQMIFHLKRGGVVLYPTDTIWGIGCDATDNKAIERIFSIKDRSFSKTMIILVDSFEMLHHYVSEVPHFLKEYLSENQEPTSVIYPYKGGLSPLVVKDGKTVAVRIVCDDFCKGVIQGFGRPIVSTSANISGGANPTSFKDIDKHIINSVDFTVNYKRSETGKGFASRLIDVSGEEIVFLR